MRQSIYYYMGRPLMKGKSGEGEKFMGRGEEKLFLTIRDEEAIDPRFTGGKGAGLAKIYRAVAELQALGLPIDVPFAVILGPPFVRRLLASNPRVLELVRELEDALSRGKDVGGLLAKIRALIMKLEFPPELEKALGEAIELIREEGLKVGKQEPIRIAVRSSGLAEDLPSASFAGQYETILNVRLELEEVEKAVLECLASVYGDRVTDYRQKLRDRGLKIPSEVEICSRGLFSIILQIMVDSEFSGVGFSIDTESGNPNILKSTAWLGLGELGVQGKVPTAEIFAAKRTYKRYLELFGRRIPSSIEALGVNPPAEPQKEKLVWDPESGKNVIVEVKEPVNPRIVNDAQALLISLAVEHLEKAVGKGRPVDVEFAWEKGRLYLLQVRPETVHATKSKAIIETYVLEEEPPEDALIGVGLNVGTKIASGPLMPLLFGDLPTEELAGRIRLLKRILTKMANEKGVKPMLFTHITSPPWEPVMKRDLVSGIVTELGNRTSHPAIISREEGLACSVGTRGLRERLDELKDILWGAACPSCDFCAIGEVGAEPVPASCPECGSELFTVVAKEPVTLDCTAGEARIYRGALKFRVDVRELRTIPSPKTKVAVNCGSPMEALHVSLIPGVSKVGLAREEFIAAWIQVHPVFCVEASRVRAEGGFWAPEVEELFPPGADPREEWIYRLTLGMGLIAASFFPREVILRFSDFKTNEYATLVGAVYYELRCPRCGRGLALKAYEECPKCGSPVEARKVELEPREANPMMGWRGVSRYLDPRFKDAFMMEVEAMIRCHRKGLTNLIPMFPFVRHPEEARDVTELVRREFERRGLRPPKMIFMAEVPSIGLVPYLFNPWCDGYSFGTNDYTQLITGTDRDSPFLPFNEDVPAVRMAIATVADSAHLENYEKYGILGPAEGRVEPEKGYPKELGICGQAPSDLPDFLKFLAIYLDYVSVNPDAVMRTLDKLKEVEEELRQLCEKCGRDPKRIAEELSKEFELWDPFGQGRPGVSEFRARWLMAKLGLEPADDGEKDRP